MRYTSNDPALVGINLPAKWIRSLDRATDLMREQYPRLPDAELLQAVFVAGILAILQRFDEPPFDEPSGVV